MYYIINKLTREVIRESHTPFNIDETVQPSDPLIQLKRVDVDTTPAFDPATQKIVRQFADNDAAFTRTFSNVVVAMTRAEKDAYALRQSDSAELVQLRAVYNDLKNGVGTATQRTVRLEKCVAWLLREYVRNQ